MMSGLEELVDEYEPDVLLCYGNTSSTLVAVIVVSKPDVKLAHVEAGLRSFNHDMPEEMNRILTDYDSDILFAPGELVVDNLKSQGSLTVCTTSAT